MAPKRSTSSRLANRSKGDFRSNRQNLIYLTPKPGFLHKSGKELESNFESKLKNNFDPAFSQHCKMQQRRSQADNSRANGVLEDGHSYTHRVSPWLPVKSEISRYSCELENPYATSSNYQTPQKNSYQCNSYSNQLSRKCRNYRNSPYKIDRNSSPNGECSVSSASDDSCRVESPRQFDCEESRSNQPATNGGSDHKNSCRKGLEALEKNVTTNQDVVDDANKSDWNKNSFWKILEALEKNTTTNQDVPDDANQSDGDITKYEYVDSSSNCEYHAEDGDQLGYKFNDRSTEFNAHSTEFNDRSTEFNDRSTEFNDCSVEFNDRRIKFNDRSMEPVTAGMLNVSMTSEGSMEGNFRELSLYPTYSEDITYRKFWIASPNATNGAYNSVEHYLYTQLYVLRENSIIDQLRALREYQASKFCQCQKPNFFYGNLCLYPNTRFQYAETSKGNKRSILLNFDPQPQTREIAWKWSNRFAIGSLLVFSSDDFHTLFFGTVLESTPSMLQRGEVSIALIEESAFRDDLPHWPFLMAETKILFEPYRLTMNQLKDLDKDTFPMKKYIVDGQSQSEPPAYLYLLPEISIGSQTYDPFASDTWPSADSLGLDPFQYAAYKAALTREFCVIRGPPGTGKTFVGLKIVQTIWRSALSIRINELMTSPAATIFREFQKGPRNNKAMTLPNEDEDCDPEVLRLPILIVCLTNDALDRFLEGVLKFTQKVIRVDGPCGEVMKNFSCDQTESRRLEKKAFLESVLDERYHQLAECSAEIERISRAKECIEQPIGILRLAVLDNAMHPNHRKCFLSDEDFHVWLLGDGDDQLDSESNAEDRGAENGEADGSDSVDQPDYGEYFSLTSQGLRSTCQKKIEELDFMKTNVTYDVRSQVHCSKHHNQILALQRDIGRLKRQFEVLKNHLQNPSVEPECSIKSLLLRHPLKLAPESRWVRYWCWVLQLRDYFTNRLTSLEELRAAHREKIARYEECLLRNDVRALRQADIVGVTTAGAARLSSALKSLGPAVVVIEEAAQMLEANIVASLTRGCQHVILIGDCGRLQPSAAVAEFSRKYNVEISLFKRMLQNGMDCPTLMVQHRMRPEVSCLVSLIYPDLKNHESVFEFESVKGVKKNVFFVDHREHEQVLDENQTEQNIHEAKFTIALAKYFLQQGYNPENITILTTCIGQMFLLRELKKEMSVLAAVKCDVVENFEAGENKIILLSLVRSNAKNDVGMLNTKCKVAVALSRAKKGLYMIGNMDCLSGSSELWARIRETLEKNGAIGNALELYCSKHDELTMVASFEDFAHAKEGGCEQPCGDFSDCGHQCPNLCHKHEGFKCREPCTTVCWRNHPCELLCYETCNECTILVELTLPCLHVKLLPCNTNECTYMCDEIVEDVFPICNHKVKRKCSQKIEDLTCTLPCRDRLDCGHACARNCHKNDDPDHTNYVCRKKCGLRNCPITKHPCEKLCYEKCDPCLIKVSKRLNCGHEAIVQCSTDIATVQCSKKCARVCERCNNPCRKLCSEDCDPCQIMFEKTIPECGHVVSLECFRRPTQEWCNAKCERLAPCGHPCQLMCCQPCSNEKCQQIVKLDNCILPTLCGHNLMYARCYQTNEAYREDPKQYLPFCQAPCDVLLECGDLCTGTCGECWQGRLHRPCNKERQSTTPYCSHLVKHPCCQPCPPCTQPCSSSCNHSECRKECIKPCAPCKEKCDWKCEHSQCTAVCGELCNREPCMEPCPKQLPCSHDCIGFCGEPCPPLCRVCNPEVAKFEFCYEEEPDARFVLLEDCQHTIESKVMWEYLSTPPENGEIVLKGCLRCKTPINKTRRFMNFTKQTNFHITNIKKKIIKKYDEASSKINSDLFDKLQLLQNSDLRLFTEVTRLRLFLVRCCNRMSTYESQKKRIPWQELLAIEFYHDVFRKILSRKEEISRLNALADDIFQYLDCLLQRLRKTAWCVTPQLISDVNDELSRYHWMVDFWTLAKNPLYVANKNHRLVSGPSTSIRQILFGVQKFTKEARRRVQESFEALEVGLKSPKPLTAAEKHLINEAMKKEFLDGGAETGHWFTCSNGHYYVITECGGALQRANCPECGEEIGGENHQYVPTARLATDMDGAAAPAHPSGRDMPHHVVD